MNIAKTQKKVAGVSGGRVKVELKDNCIVLTGSVDSWEEAVEACSAAAVPYSKIHVVNDIEVKNLVEKPMRMPAICDSALVEELILPNNKEDAPSNPGLCSREVHLIFESIPL